MKNKHLFQIYRLLMVLGLVCLIAIEGAGQALSIGGGNQTLTITTGTPGGALTPVTNTNCSLTFTAPSGGGNPPYSISVSATCVGPSFGLSVLATSVTSGNGSAVAASTVPVVITGGSVAVPFITGIKKTTGSCILQYTASATFADGNSNDRGDGQYAITYTLQTP